MQPSQRSRAAPELGSKSTDIAMRQRKRLQEGESLNFPRVDLITGKPVNQEYFQNEKKSETVEHAYNQANEEVSDYQVGTFRITDTTPSVIKIRRHSYIQEGVSLDDYEKKRPQIHSNQSERSLERNYNGGYCQEQVEQLENLDTEDISIKAMRNEDQLEEISKNDSFYFSNRNQELMSSENDRSEKKNSGNSLWDANNLLDEQQLPQETDQAPPHNLSSFMIMEMLKKNKERQKRHKLIRNISNADTQEFRSHRSISEIYEAAQEEEDGFLCDESDAFVRRFNTTGGELSQAIQDLVQRSKYTSAKI